MAAQLRDLDEKCKKTIEHFKKDLGRMRTGRASTSMLEGIHVDYYGSSVPLIQLGMVNAPEPRLITVQVYDPGAVEAVEKSIHQSDLGLNPAREGNLIRLNIPALTEERRKEIVKKLHKMAEDVRVTLRNHRRDSIDEIKKQEKAKSMSEDDSRRQQEEVQKLIDKHSKDVDTVVQQKEKEVLEV